jgi:hypothetical protein
MFNATFNNILVISCRSVLLLEEIGVHGEIIDLLHILLYRVHPTGAGFELRMLVVIATDCIGSCRSNYHITWPLS